MERRASSLYLKMAIANRNRTLLPSYRKVSQIRSIVCIRKRHLLYNIMYMYHSLEPRLPFQLFITSSTESGELYFMQSGTRLHVSYTLCKVLPRRGKGGGAPPSHHHQKKKKKKKKKKGKKPPDTISEHLEFKIFLGGHTPPPPSSDFLRRTLTLCMH